MNLKHWTVAFLLAIPRVATAQSFPDSSRSTVWPLDNLERIGGFDVTVAGQPIVKTIDGSPAIEFDGVDDGIIVHGCPLDRSQSFTMELLFKPYPALPQNAEQRIVHVQDQLYPSRRALIESRLTSSNAWFVDTHIRADSSFLTLRDSLFLHPIGPWYHIALVCENGVGRHFVNGVEEMSGSVPFIPLMNAHVSIGMRMNRIWFFKGAIRAVALSRNALGIQSFALLPSVLDGQRRDSLILADDFVIDSGHWIPEFEDPQGSMLRISNRALEIDASGGATVWLNKKFCGNVEFSYQITVADSGGRNDRVSDLNFFWMARDSLRDTPFGRSGKFSEYDDLDLYYCGIGGHDNSTTRFRRYHPSGRKPVLQEYTDHAHLLEANRSYAIVIRVHDARTTVHRDGELLFDFVDPVPLGEGYFAFRTTRSRQRITKFKVVQILD